MTPFLPLLTIILTLTLHTPTNAQTVLAHICESCACEAAITFTKHNFQECVNLPSSAWSISLVKEVDAHTHTNHGVKCTAFSNWGCWGSYQPISIDEGEEYTCADTRIGWVKSVACGVVEG